MAIEKTLAIIKPDAVAKNYAGKILAQIEANGLKIVASKMTHLTREKAEKFYSEHVDQIFYKPLIKYMSSGPIIVKVFGKCISNAFVFVKPINIFSAAYSEDLIIGIENLFLSVRGVFIKPGLTRDTLTSYLLKSK